MSRAAVLVLTGFIAVFATAALAWSAAAALQQEPEVRLGQEVTICHETGNGKWVLQSPDADSIVSENGHGGHPGDIIPPFDYPPSGQDPGGHYPGQHWEEGEAILDNGCVDPEPPNPPTGSLGNSVKGVDNFAYYRTMPDEPRQPPSSRLSRSARLGGLVAGQSARWAGTRAANVVRSGTP